LLALVLSGLLSPFSLCIYMRLFHENLIVVLKMAAADPSETLVTFRYTIPHGFSEESGKEYRLMTTEAICVVFAFEVYRRPRCRPRNIRVSHLHGEL
jgi:hypothetical protein